MTVTSAPHIITDADELALMVQEYLQHPAFCFDVETVGDYRILPLRNIVTVIAFATDGRHDVVPIRFPHGNLDHTVFPLTASAEARKLEAEQAGKTFTPRKTDHSVDVRKAVHTWLPAPEHLGHDAWEIMRPLLMSDRLKVGHNIKFDLQSVRKYLGACPPPPYGDTMIAAYLVRSNHNDTFGVHNGYALDSVCMRETGYPMVKGVGKEVEAHGWDEVMRYAGVDAKFTWLCWRMLRRKVSKAGLQPVMDLEMDVLEVLLEMEHAGALIDREALDVLDDQLTNKFTGLIPAAAAKVFTLAKYPKFPLTNGLQKIDMLFGPKAEGGQGLKPTKFTPKSTDENPRPSLADDALLKHISNPVVAALRQHDALTKLHSTYVRSYKYGTPVKGSTKLQPLVYKGHIHAQFNQIGAVTGRFSCSSPNLQNVPSPATEMGRAIRSLFIAPPDHQLVVADFSQIELRVLAHFCGDPVLTQAFLDDEDVHQATADKLNSTRKVGKELNFTVVYGGGRDLVAERAEIKVLEAGEFMAAYERLYPGIFEWKKQVAIDCKREKPTPCVRTLMGRVRFLPKINDSESYYIANSERQAANTIVQGSAADIIKLAMVRTHRALPADCQLILTVHDELVVTVPTAHAEKAAAVITEAMEGAYKLTVPLPADVKIVDRWSDAKPVKS